MSKTAKSGAGAPLCALAVPLCALAVLACASLMGSGRARGADPTADSAAVREAWEQMPKVEREDYRECRKKVEAGEEWYVSTGASSFFPRTVYCPSGVPGLDRNSLYRCYLDERGKAAAVKVAEQPLYAGSWLVPPPS